MHRDARYTSKEDVINAWNQWKAAAAAWRDHSSGGHLKEVQILAITDKYLPA